MSLLNEFSAEGATIAQTHALQRNGIDLFVGQYYDEAVSADAPHILLAHGLTYSSHEFDVDYEDYSLVRFLSKSGFNVWVVDVAGYGRSGAPESGFLPDTDYAAQDIAATVEYVRQEEGVEKIDLLGWSWGTVTASRMATLHPEWVRKLVLYAPIHRGLGRDRLTSDWHKNSWLHAADDFQKRPGGAIDDSIAEKAVVATYLSNCWRYDGERSPNGGRRDLLQGSQVVLFDERRLLMPVLLIGGSKDPYMNWDDLRASFRNLPQMQKSRLVEIEGASHVMMFEKPYYRRLHQEILDFLTD